jgi:hypothetical protein
MMPSGREWRAGEGRQVHKNRECAVEDNSYLRCEVRRWESGGYTN